MNTADIPSFLIGVLMIVIFGLLFLSPVISLIWLFIVKKPTPKGVIGVSSIALFLWGVALPKLFPMLFEPMGATFYGVYHAVILLLVVLFWRSLSHKRNGLKVQVLAVSTTTPLSS